MLNLRQQYAELEVRLGFKTTPTQEPVAQNAGVLCVDLDGTLTRSDFFWESIVIGLRHAPLKSISALISGGLRKAAMKARFAEIAADHINVENLPYDRSVLTLLKQRKAEGWRLELVSGAHHSFVEKVSEHLGVFLTAFGSDDKRNLIGKTKAAFMKERHPDGFSYLGNSSADEAPWRVASERLSANAPSGLVKKLRQTGLSLQEISRQPGFLAAALKAMRLHQWGKNLLLFTVFALTVAQQTVANFFLLGGAFLAFGLIASATYLINDILDIEADRSHPTKHKRPFASGALSIPLGVILSAGLGVVGLAIGGLISGAFASCLVLYVAMTIAYSLKLKSIPLIDVLMLGGLFSLRIFAGAAVIGGVVAPWLTVFSLLFFCSLAFAKRYVEMSHHKDTEAQALAGRGYVSGDSLFVFVFGAAFATASLLVFLLYVFSGESQAIRNANVALLCLGVLAYWIMRVWLLTARGEMKDDPVLFACRDKVSYAAAAAIGVGLLIDHWIA